MSTTQVLENFSLAKIKSLCAIDAKAYLMKYFVPLSDGNHAFYEDGKFVIREQKVIKSTYFNRMSKELNDYYFRDYTDIRKVTYELNKPIFYGDYINLCPTIKAKNDLPYSSYNDKVKQGVLAMVQFIKEVLADDNEQSCQYLLKWISNMLKGEKNDACLYLKGQQGIGKSTLTDFLKHHVIGTDLMLETGSEPLKNKFNIILGGKLLVLFEELENFSVNEWSAVSSVLKRLLTSKTITLEGKNANSFQSNNMNNYILNSNNDAIKDDDGRRYFILDINHKYKGNHDFFGKLRRNSFNDDVGRAFYSYMMEVNTTDFIPQQFPTTQSKLNSIAKRLDKAYEFIKERFILTNSEMNITAKDLYVNYEQFCNINGIKKLDKTTFNEKLKQVGIEYRKTKGNHYFVYSHDELLAIANKNKWIHELDSFDDNSNLELDVDYDSILQEKESEIKMLKAIIEEQKKALEALQIDLVETL